MLTSWPYPCFGLWTSPNRSLTYFIVVSKCWKTMTASKLRRFYNSCIVCVKWEKKNFGVTCTQSKLKISSVSSEKSLRFHFFNLSACQPVYVWDTLPFEFLLVFSENWPSFCVQIYYFLGLCCFDKCLIIVTCKCVRVHCIIFYTAHICEG